MERDIRSRAVEWAEEVAENAPRSDETNLKKYLVAKLLEFVHRKK